MQCNLKDYQIKTIDFIQHHNKVLCANDMGTGKTRCAIETIKQRCLIIVPTSLKLNWYYEIKKWSKIDKIFINDLTIKTQKQLQIEDIRLADVAIISYHSLHKYSDFLDKFDYVILDEAHIIKNTKANITKYIMRLIADKDKLLFLTGTPIKNKIEDLFVFYKLCSDNKAKLWDFCLKYSNLVIKQFGNVKIKTFEGVKNEEELKRKLNAFYIRYENKDIKLPELIRINTYDFATPSEQKLFISLLNNFDLPDILTDKDLIKLSNYTVLRKALSVAKTNIAINKIKELRENMTNITPIIFMSCFLDSCVKITEFCIKNKLRYACITGDTSSEKRQEYAQMCQENKLDVLIGTLGAMSVGLTLTQADHLILNDLSYTPADNSQAEKRHHRIGSINTKYVHIINLKMIGCRDIDKEVNQILLDKSMIIEKIIKK